MDGLTPLRALAALSKLCKLENEANERNFSGFITIDTVPSTLTRKKASDMPGKANQSNPKSVLASGVPAS